MSPASRFGSVRRHAARTARTIGKTVLFFALWLAVAIVPVALWDNPTFLVGRTAWLRLYWEVAPLVMTLALTYVFVRFIDKRSVAVSITRHPGRDSLLGIGMGVFWVGLVTGVLWGAGFLTVTGTNPVPHLLGIYMVALFANTCTQELLVHGYLFSYLRCKHNTVAAVVVTTLFFAGLHAGAFNAGLLPILNVLATGLFFALLLIASDGLWLPVIVHFVWNLLGGMILGQVNLGDPHHSLNTTLTGPAPISGGNALMEGSVVTLMATLILCGITGVAARKNTTTAGSRK